MPADTTIPATCTLLTIKQLSAALGIHQRTCRRLAGEPEAGQGCFPKPLRIGPKTVRWRLGDVESYLSGLAGEGKP